MPSNYRFKIGRVTTILPSGLGYVRLEEETRTRPFVVGKALRGYSGCPYENFGLSADALLFVALEGSDIKCLVPEDRRAPAEAVREMKTLLQLAFGSMYSGGAIRGPGTLERPSDRFLSHFIQAHGETEGVAELMPGQPIADVEIAATEKSW